MTLPAASEAEIENAIRDLFLRAGWFAAKTDAAMISRGRGRVQRGHLPLGFPDMTFFLGVPGTGLCVAALIEVKTPAGRLRSTQLEMHATLRDLYGIKAHVVRDAADALNLIQEGRAVVKALRGVNL